MYRIPFGVQPSGGTTSLKRRFFFFLIQGVCVRCDSYEEIAKDTYLFCLSWVFTGNHGQYGFFHEQWQITRCLNCPAFIFQHLIVLELLCHLYILTLGLSELQQKSQEAF